jgi:uncharacterized protein (DUF2062 family)
MFKRRNPRPFFARLREYVWPSLGWRRMAIYTAHRIKRLPGSTYSIAAGFACGAAISFTPFIGFHFLLGALLAWIMGGNIMASAIGTAVGNPWTFPFIWYWTFHFGSWLLGFGFGATQLPENLSLGHIFNHPLEVLLPMTVGGIPTGLLAWFVCYWPIYRMVDGYRRARQHRIERRARRAEQGARVRR